MSVSDSEVQEAGRAHGARLLGPGDAQWLDRFLGNEEIWSPQSGEVTTDENRYRSGSLLLARSDVRVLRGDWHTVLIARELWPRVCELHVNVLRPGRGRPAVRATRRCFAWLFDHTPSETLVALPGSHRPDARRFASLCGMSRSGTIPASLYRDGRMLDRVVMALQRTEFVDSR